MFQSKKIIDRIKNGSSKELINKIRKGDKDSKIKLPCILFFGYILSKK